MTYAAVIVEAGPVGLSTACELARESGQPPVLEHADKFGGIARTEVYEGYRFDIGGHRCPAQDNGVQHLCLASGSFSRAPPNRAL